MYAASRIILALKRKNEGYEEVRSLSEEEPAARVMTVIITYSRLILIAGKFFSFPFFFFFFFFWQ